MKYVIAVILAWSLVARAGAPTLVAHDAGAYSVSLPKGWTVVDNAAQNTVVAQQDPKRKDAAQLLVIVSASVQASADQLLDALLKNGLVDGKVTKREALGDSGKLLVADGKAEGVAARMGAIALTANGGAIVGVLISKAGDFDALGGTNTIVAVLGTIVINGASAGKPATPSPGASSGARDPIMTPEYHGDSLWVPDVQRTLELVDLVGEWNAGDGAGRMYVSSNGNWTGGFSSLSTAETWLIDAKGNVKDNFAAGYASNSGAHGFKQVSTGTVTVNANNTISFRYPPQNGNKERLEDYIVIGWFVGPEMTLLKVQGPFYGGVSAKDLKDAPSNSYRNHTYVTKRKHP